MAVAYNEDGHYYTVAALEQERRIIPAGLSAEQFDLVVLCAQMPDLSRELDAVTLKVRNLGTFGGWLWGGFSACVGDGVRNMTEVHHYLHALTDGESAKVEKAADSLVRRLRAAWLADHSDAKACALGLGIHLLGDAHSHRRLGNEARMYAPGMGHFRDDHDPDYITFPNREPLWERYVGMLGAAHDITAHADHRAALFKVAQARLTGGSRSNYYYSKEIIKEIGALKAPDGGHALGPWPQNAPAVDEYHGKARGLSQFVLDTSFDDVMTTYRGTKASQASLSAVWPAYIVVAREEFRKVQHPAACDGN